MTSTALSCYLKLTIPSTIMTLYLCVKQVWMTRLICQMYCWKIIPLCLVIIQVIQETVEVGLFYKNDLPSQNKRRFVIWRVNNCWDCYWWEKSILHSCFTKVLTITNHNNSSCLWKHFKKDNPFAIFFAGDFNGHSQVWWKDDDTTAEGREMELPWWVSWNY